MRPGAGFMTRRRDPTRKARDPNAPLRATVLWAGVGLAVTALAGLVVFPAAILVWIPLLVFAVAAVPQALLLPTPAREKRAHSNPRAATVSRDHEQRANRQ